MMTQKSELGRYGEEFACKYLVDKGYKVIDQNFRQKWGEIDIIAKTPDKTLVFVEVKTMRDNSHNIDHGNGLKPEDQLTQAKLHKLQKTARLYAGHYPENVDNKRGWRIDLVGISISPGREPEIKHYENI